MAIEYQENTSCAYVTKLAAVRYESDQRRA